MGRVLILTFCIQLTVLNPITMQLKSDEHYLERKNTLYDLLVLLL